ncbi:MAG: hypothetical protein ACYC4U_05170 [Pirellulaceae bacterium]
MSQTNQSRRKFLCQAAAGTLAATAVQREASTVPPPPGPGRVLRCSASYYQQFDADHGREVPAEGYGGWQRTEIELDLNHTALVSMHAWETGTREMYPGWYRAVEYIPRAQEICRTVYPRLLTAVRSAHATLFHVVGGGAYYQTLPGYQRAVGLAGPPPPAPVTVPADASLKKLQELRHARVFVGPHNADDVQRGFAKLDFAAEARPVGDEGVAENGHQLLALCQDHGINHLVYFGFAINWCLLMSPGGMLEMSRHGVMCSAIRQATTAVESRESARQQWAKELGLWRVALAWGFVFDVDDLVAALARGGGRES